MSFNNGKIDLKDLPHFSSAFIQAIIRFIFLTFLIHFELFLWGFFYISLINAVKKWLFKNNELGIYMVDGSIS